MTNGTTNASNGASSDEATAESRPIRDEALIEVDRQGEATALNTRGIEGHIPTAGKGYLAEVRGIVFWI